MMKDSRIPRFLQNLPNLLGICNSSKTWNFFYQEGTGGHGAECKKGK